MRSQLCENSDPPLLLLECAASFCSQLLFNAQPEFLNAPVCLPGGSHQFVQMLPPTVGTSSIRRDSVPERPRDTLAARRWAIVHSIHAMPRALPGMPASTQGQRRLTIPTILSGKADANAESILVFSKRDAPHPTPVLVFSACALGATG